ncbi:ATP synthase gamma chain [Azospirillaceae bacterium]
MVERLAELQARITNLGELQDIMGAMRALAAMRLQQAQNALPGIRRYTEVLNGALARGLLLVQDSAGSSLGRRRGGRQAVVAFTSEHGFAGAYNEHVLDRAAEALEEGDRLAIIGTRGRIKAEERGLAVVHWQPMTTHIDGVRDTAMRLIETLFQLLSREGLERVTLVYGRNSAGAAWTVEVEPVLPFDPTLYRRPDAVVPMVYLDPEVLFDHLVEEFVFTRLMHAGMESFASENGARLAAMEAAHDNIETKLETLTQNARQQRQEEITTELLDVVIGATAAREG